MTEIRGVFTNIFRFLIFIFLPFYLLYLDVSFPILHACVSVSFEAISLLQHAATGFFGWRIGSLYPKSQRQGKTNILESVSILSTGKSCIQSETEPIIQWGRILSRKGADGVRYQRAEHGGGVCFH